MFPDLVARLAFFCGKTLLPVELEADARVNAANANFMFMFMVPIDSNSNRYMNGDNNNSLRVQMFYRYRTVAEEAVPRVRDTVWRTLCSENGTNGNSAEMKCK